MAAAGSAAGRSQRLVDLGEDQLLGEVFPFFPASPAILVGPGDDAAVVATGEAVVVTTDAMVRGRDWKDAWSSAEDVAVKAVTQNVADLAAMGAAPRILVVTLVADPNTRVDWVRGFARSLGGQAAALDMSVAGGDLSSAPPGVLVLSITALGDLEGRPPVLRSGARAGNTVALGGTLGRSAAGLLVLESDPALTSPAAVQRLIDSQPHGIRAGCVAHHLRPTTPIALGLAAAGAGATAMMDISDGLLRDGARLAAASGVRLDLDGDALEGDVGVLIPLVGRPTARECVLAGGEEHSLLATFPTSPPSGWRPIGRVVPGAGVAVDGQDEVPRGWDHFAS